VQVACASEIRAGFLRPGEGQELTHCRALAHHHQAKTSVACACRDCDCAEHHGRKGDPGRFLHAFAHADRVSAGDVAELVGNNELKLVHIVGPGQEARVDVDVLAARNEGVDFVVVEKDDLNAFVVEVCGLDQRLGDVGEESFGLRVTENRWPFVSRDCGPRRGKSKHQRQHQHPHEAGKRRAHAAAFPPAI